MQALRVMIADDELQARKRLQRLLESMPGVCLVGSCKDGAEVLEMLSGPAAVEVDLLLLDIRMPGLSGLEARAFLGEEGPYTVFVTAHDVHALEAFEVGAGDYLLKPVDAVKLERALSRAARILGRAAVAGASEASVAEAGPRARLAVETREGVVLLDPAEIDAALLEGELVTLWTQRGDFLTELSLQRLEERLGGPGPGVDFVRGHRRALLNLERLDRLEPLPSGGYRAWFSRPDGRGRHAPVSRQAARALRRRFGL